MNRDHPWRPPYCVQRASIRRPLNNTKGMHLGAAVNLDYMGSAEFEFGALPASLKAIEKVADNFNVHLFDRIKTSDGTPLRVAHALDADKWTQYQEWLVEMRQKESPSWRMKERTLFDDRPSRAYGADIDFWWDIRNHVMWSFDKVFMSRLLDHLAASIKVMIAQETKA